MTDDAKGAGVRVLLTNAPDAETAARIGRTLVEERLAACVNVLAPCLSIYHWDGQLQQEHEVPVLIKTSAASAARAIARIAELHPYDVPEVLCLEPQDGWPDYLRWVVSESGGG